MFVDSRNGQPHFICYFLHGFIVHAPQKKYSAALNRQGIDYRLETPELIAHLQRAFGRTIRGYQIDIGNHLEGHNFFASRLIDDHVPRNREKVALAIGYSEKIRGAECPCHGL